MGLEVKLIIAAILKACDCVDSCVDGSNALRFYLLKELTKKYILAMPHLCRIILHYK